MSQSVQAAIREWEIRFADSVLTAPTRDHFKAAGVYYHEELSGPEGMRFALIREAHHTNRNIADAKRELRRTRDVTGITVVRAGENKMAKTAKQLLEEARAKEAADIERAAIDRHKLERFARILPDDFAFDKVHAHSLYGSSGSVTIGNDPRYGEEDRRVDVYGVAGLLLIFPPIPTVIHKAGCTSFRALRYKPEKEESGVTELVWPVRIEVEPFQGLTTTVKWLTAGKDVGEESGFFRYYEVNAILKPESTPVRVDVRMSGKAGTGRYIERCDLIANPHFPGHFWTDQRIKWAAAGREYPNRFTLYWLDQDDSLGVGRTWLETICGMDYEAPAATKEGAPNTQESTNAHPLGSE